MTDKLKVRQQVLELKGLQDRADRMSNPFSKAQIAQQAVPLAIKVIDALVKEVFPEEADNHG